MATDNNDNEVFAGTLSINGVHVRFDKTQVLGHHVHTGELVSINDTATIIEFDGVMGIISSRLAQALLKSGVLADKANE